MKDFDIAVYTARFREQTLLCPEMVTPESKKVGRHILGLTPPTQGNITTANPLTFNSAKHMAQILVDHGYRQGSMPTVPKKPKEGGSKKKFWNM